MDKNSQKTEAEQEYHEASLAIRRAAHFLVEPVRWSAEKDEHQGLITRIENGLVESYCVELKRHVINGSRDLRSVLHKWRRLTYRPSILGTCGMLASIFRTGGKN